MALNRFNSFIRTLKTVLHKIAQYLRLGKTAVETQPKILEKKAQVSEILPETPEKQEIPSKALSQTIQEEIPVEIPSQVPQEESREEESEPELIEELKDIEPKKHMEDEKAIPMPRKPYKKRAPMEERKGKSGKLSPTEKKPSELKQWETYLGDLPQKLRQTKRPRRLLVDKIGNEMTDRGPEEKEVTESMGSPFVEIDLDESKVFLVLPQQHFKVDPTEEMPQQLSYELELDGEKQEVIVKATDSNRGFSLLQEKRICLETPVKNLRVKFPDKVQGRVYSYIHNNESLYAFVAIGNNRGRMHYLYNKDGNINPISRRVVWILVSEDFGLQTELGIGDIIGEEWIWKHKPFRIDLREKSEITIVNKTTSNEILFPCKATFSVEGEEAIKDDFIRECPLFTDKCLRIMAPDVNPLGWVVWIQNKVAGYRVVSRSWAGAQPLTLRLPEDLPCECGEFQVDICQQDTRIPDETLFFRWLPFIKLDYPQRLIIPDSHRGHGLEIINVDLGSIQGWELKTTTKFIEKGFYQIELPSEEDTLHFLLSKKGKPETETRLQVTIPRLRWKTSKHEDWNDKLLEIKRGELIPGQDFHLFISTNDLFNEHDLLAMLKINGQELQTTKFVRRGIHHTLLLNEFYDTIKQNKDALTLRAGIRRAKDYELLGTAEILYFDAEQVIRIPRSPKPVSYDLVNTLNLPKICHVLRRIRAMCSKEKAACKEILQLYYQGIRGERRLKGETRYRKIFVVKSLAFMKFIMNTYGDRVSIKGQKKWRTRIDLLQQRYPEEFDSALDTYSRR